MVLFVERYIFFSKRVYSLSQVINKEKMAIVQMLSKGEGVDVRTNEIGIYIKLK